MEILCILLCGDNFVVTIGGSFIPLVLWFGDGKGICEVNSLMQHSPNLPLDLTLRNNRRKNKNCCMVWLLCWQNQMSGYLQRKFKNSNGWQKLWVVFANFCLFFYKNFQVTVRHVWKICSDLHLVWTDSAVRKLLIAGTERRANFLPLKPVIR